MPERGMRSRSEPRDGAYPSGLTGQVAQDRETRVPWPTSEKVENAPANTAEWNIPIEVLHLGASDLASQWDRLGCAVAVLGGGVVRVVVRCALCFAFTGVRVRIPVPWARFSARSASRELGVSADAVTVQVG